MVTMVTGVTVDFFVSMVILVTTVTGASGYIVITWSPNESSRIVLLG